MKQHAFMKGFMQGFTSFGNVFNVSRPFSHKIHTQLTLPPAVKDKIAFEADRLALQGDSKNAMQQLMKDYASHGK